MFSVNGGTNDHETYTPGLHCDGSYNPNWAQDDERRAREQEEEDRNRIMSGPSSGSSGK